MLCFGLLLLLLLVRVGLMMTRNYVSLEYGGRQTFTFTARGGWWGGGVTLGGDSAAGGAGVGAEAWDKKSQ